MKEIKNYIVLVDNYRRPSRRRNTAGRYRVAAKTPKEAAELLREKIGFGAIHVYYECNPNDPYNVPYKTVVKEEFQEIREADGSTRRSFVHTEPRHATAPQKAKEGAE